MVHDINGLRESGLLELYVLGQLSENEIAQVEDAANQNQSIREQIVGIEQTLKGYAMAYAITPDPMVKDNIMKSIQSSAGGQVPQPPRPSAGSFGWLFGLVVIGAGLLLFWMNNKHTQEVSEFKNQLAVCDSIQTQNNIEIAIFESLQSADNLIVAVDATENYPGTDLYIHNNEVSGKNYLQVRNLPDLAPDQSFQLWSLKGDNPPIPLDVFETDKGSLFEISQVEGTNAYAITIEPRGGQDSPTLERLIGVFAIGS